MKMIIMKINENNNDENENKWKWNGRNNVKNVMKYEVIIMMKIIMKIW